MISIEGPAGFDSHNYLAVLRRRRGVIAIVTFLIVAVALLTTVLQTPTYGTTATIVFQRSPASSLTPGANTQSFDPGRDVQTQIAVLTSEPVRKLVLASLHITGTPKIAATPVLGSNAIKVKATSSSPVLASRIANAYASSYIEFSRTQTINGLLDAEQLIQGRITDLQNQIDAVNAKINSSPPEGLAKAEANLGPQRSALLAQQSVLKQQLDQSQLQSALSSTGAQLGSPAPVPGSPSSPHPVTNVVSALFLGLLLGLGLAFLLDFLDNSIKSAKEAEQAAYGVATLGLIPTVAGWKARTDTVLASVNDPSSPAAEAYRGLRTAIQFLGTDRSLHVLQVTSPGAGDGKTTTLTNLAVALGRSGSRVCVVDCDLRRPRIHEFFGLANDRGFTSVVRGDLPLSLVLQPTALVENVMVLPSGIPPIDPSELLASERAAGVLRSLASQFDIVLADSPPVLAVTDASALSRWVDGVIVVADTGRTKKRALTRTIELLRQVEAPVIGLVVNRATGENEYGYAKYVKYAEAGKRPNGSAAPGNGPLGYRPDVRPRSAPRASGPRSNVRDHPQPSRAR